MNGAVLTPPKPPRVVRDRYYEAALAWAQEFTEGLEELPRGEPREYQRCPLARATGRGVGPELSFVLGDDFDPGIRHSPLVQEFISRFDSGLYPDLIER